MSFDLSGCITGRGGVELGLVAEIEALLGASVGVSKGLEKTTSVTCTVPAEKSKSIERTAGLTHFVGRTAKVTHLYVLTGVWATKWYCSDPCVIAGKRTIINCLDEES